ncbi:MAG: hypothetical protein KDM91_07710 [Verrucomicrobiae bacterium]|nr:hypothetical protein [Verrucomicrobiae bacterium]MCP5541108.1 hypothetical protein [Akkermansiaceae bacterium]
MTRLRPTAISGAVALALSLASGAAKDIHALKDWPVFAATAKTWEGVGVSFDIVDGQLGDAVTFRDRWEAEFKEDGRLMEMRGVTRAGGRKIEYLWRFRFHPETETVTGEFETSEGGARAVEVTVVAEGKRIEIRTPQSADSKAGLAMDIYLEDGGDLITETRTFDREGKDNYRSAARYRAD